MMAWLGRCLGLAPMAEPVAATIRLVAADGRAVELQPSGEACAAAARELAGADDAVCLLEWGPAVPPHLLTRLGRSVEARVLVPPHLPEAAPPALALSSAELSAAARAGDVALGARLCESLRTHGFARVRWDDGALRESYAEAERFFGRGAREKLAHTLVVDEAEAKVAGYGAHLGREWIQLRRLRRGAFPWPAEQPGLERACVRLYRELDAIGRRCGWWRRAWGRPRGAARAAGPAGPPEAPLELPAGLDPPCGSDVLRLYRYQPAGERLLEGVPACGVHADIGLLTVASRASTGRGLRLAPPRGGPFRDLEEGPSAPADCLLFAGETLGYVTGGDLRPPLHFVADDEGDPGAPRLSAPFFLRARPASLLAPLGPAPGTRGPSTPPAALTVREFVEHVLFPARPWRTAPAPPGSSPSAPSGRGVSGVGDY
eukprot:tig00001067_g6782.t1